MACGGAAAVRHRCTAVLRGDWARGRLRRCAAWREGGVDGVEAAAPELGRCGGADGDAVAPTRSGELAPVAFLRTKKSERGMSACARGSRSKWRRCDGSRVTGLVGIGEGRRQDGGAPARNFFSLGARIKRECWGNERGVDGLFIEQKKERDRGLNAGNREGDSSRFWTRDFGSRMKKV